MQLNASRKYFDDDLRSKFKGHSIVFRLQSKVERNFQFVMTGIHTPLEATKTRRTNVKKEGSNECRDLRTSQVVAKI